MSYDTALWPLQEAVYQRLDSDVSLKELIAGVFDAVPKDQVYPYVVIGEPSMLPFDTKTVPGEEISLVVHALTDYPGKKETFNILNACQKALSYKLDLPGFRILKVERLGIQVFDDIDPRIRHGVLRLKYTLRSE